MPKTRGFDGYTALYERLSKDDDLQGESNSISNQKEYLADYARKNGFINIKHYTDDGYTGRNFNRPGFQAMLADAEAGKVSTIIVKDMSRFGRNYLQVGFYTEILFPQKQVRFIAINNSVDSDSPTDNDFTPFLNIMNEWYAKDTSNKIKSIFLSRMSEGKRCSGSIPYGYNRLQGDKQMLVVDPIASKVVKHIFELAASGNNPPKIARILTEEKTLIPSAYTLQYHPEQCNMKAEMGNCDWNSNTVREILNRQEYLGHTVLRKTIATSFKTDQRRFSTDDEKLFFEDTHEAIITQKLWDNAHKRLMHSTRQHSHEELLAGCLFAGYVFCADCGRKLAFETHYYKNRERYYSFRCSNYTNKRSKCTQHHVSENNLQQLVLHLLQRITARIIEDEDAFCTMLKEKWQQQNASVPKQSKKDLIEAQRRFDELDALISGLYENYISGILPERQYKSLMIKYDTEQTELEGKIKQLQQVLTEVKVSTMDAKRFIKIIKKYKNPQELTRDMVVELIDKIVVYEPSGRKPNREQRIDIYFNFIGQLELAYTTEELAKIKENAQREADKKQVEKDKRAKERSKTFREKEKAERWEANGGHKFAERICEHCGKPYYPNSSKQRYCTKDCTYSAQQEAIKQKRLAEKGAHTFTQKECQICGKKFWPSNGREVLCAAECKAENRRKKQLEYYYKKQEKENAQWNDSSQTKERESTTNSSETTISHSSKPLTAHQSGDSADCAIAI